jgi:hypothetical protein
MDVRSTDIKVYKSAGGGFGDLGIQNHVSTDVKCGLGAGRAGVAGVGWWILPSLGEAWYARSSGDGGYIPIRASAFEVNSARDSKEQIREHKADPTKLKNLRPVKFKRKIDPLTTKRVGQAVAAIFGAEIEPEEPAPDEVGFIAEEMADVLPEAVSYDNTGEIAGINYAPIVANLVSIMQQLDARLDALERKK